MFFEQEKNLYTRAVDQRVDHADDSLFCDEIGEKRNHHDEDDICDKNRWFDRCGGKAPFEEQIVQNIHAADCTSGVQWSQTKTGTRIDCEESPCRSGAAGKSNG